MKLKEIESILTQCDVFEQPKVALEQYATSAHIASRMVYAAQEHIDGGIVCDLGSGCGILSIGSVLVGAELVYGFEIDPDAIEIAQKNVDDILKEDEDSGCAIEFVQGAIGRAWRSKDENGPPVDVCDSFHEMFDVVVMNPPFGTKNNAGADFKFLERALSLVKPGGHVYSLHKSSTRSFFQKKFAVGPLEMATHVKAEVLAKIRYDLPKCYKFHKKSSVDIEVDFWHFEKRKCQVK